MLLIIQNYVKCCQNIRVCVICTNPEPLIYFPELTGIALSTKLVHPTLKPFFELRRLKFAGVATALNYMINASHERQFRIYHREKKVARVSSPYANRFKAYERLTPPTPHSYFDYTVSDQFEACLKSQTFSITYSMQGLRPLQILKYCNHS